jgi:hypothetical protein
MDATGASEHAARPTGFGPTTRTVALVLLPVVLLIGLLMQATAAPWVVVAAGAVAFPVVWGALLSLNARTVQTLRATKPRFPTAEQDA